jgi:hypothetical protein
MFRRRLRLFQASGLIALRSSRGRLRRWKHITTRRESSFWTLKKIQYDWVKAIVTFSLKLIPGWFDFVERLLLLGALKYLEDTRNNWFVTIVYLVSLIVFYLYLQALLYNFPFDRFLPRELTKNQRVAYLFSLMVAGLLLFIINLALNSVLAAFAIK